MSMRRAAADELASHPHVADLESGRSHPRAGAPAGGETHYFGLSLRRVLLLTCALVVLWLWVQRAPRDDAGSPGAGSTGPEQLRGFIRFESFKKASDDAQRAQQLEDEQGGQGAPEQRTQSATTARAPAEPSVDAWASAVKVHLDGEAGAVPDEPRFLAKTSDAVRDTIAARYESARAQTLIVLTAGNSMYQEWQKRTAVYTLRQTNPNTATILLSSHVLPPTDALATRLDCADVYTGCPAVEYADVQYTLARPDVFIVYNRAWAMLKYFESLAAAGRLRDHTNIVLFEPDMFAVRPITTVAKRGSPIGHKYFYMNGDTPYARNLLSHCTANPEFYEPIGLPMVFHVDDLVRVLPVWVNKTIAVRTSEWGFDEQGKPSWLGDMWGLCCALCDLKIRAVPMATAPEPPMDNDMEDSADSWAIHWTFNTKVENKKSGKTYYFEKREHVLAPPKPRPFGPISHDPADGASPLQLLFADTFDEAIVAAYGKT